MRKAEVPQDAGKLGPWHRISYALDDAGRYVGVPSSGFEPVNVANDMAWAEFGRQLADARRAVSEGRASSLAWHMLHRLMDAKLLGRYAGFSAWRVRRCLKPGPFARLSPAELDRFAAALDVSVEELMRVPEEDAARPDEEGAR